MVEFGTSSAFRGWVPVRVRVLGYGFGVRGTKVKSRDCALASDLVRASFLPLFLLLSSPVLGSSRPMPHIATHFLKWARVPQRAVASRQQGSCLTMCLRTLRARLLHSHLSFMGARAKGSG